MRVVTIPRYFDEKGLDAVAGELQPWPPEDKLLFDAHATRWASPYGFTAMLTAGQALRDRGAERPRLRVPDDHAVSSYWAKAGFFHHAAEYFGLHGKVPRRAPVGSSDVLLPVTPIRQSEDVHQVVGGIQQSAERILTSELHLKAPDSMRFSMSLSEACQNVVEHAGGPGWVAVHAYNWRERLNRRVVVIAVCDSGIGFRASLEPTQARHHGDRWGDKAALEDALFHSVSRFPQPGRGQGLAAIKRFVLQHKGRLSIRSGTARLAHLPDWDNGPPLQDGLPFFPGAQLQIVIPSTEALPP
jgi:hypothetical protein